MGKNRNALQVRATTHLVEDVDLIAEWLLEQGDVARMWGDKVSRSAAMEYAITEIAKELRSRRTNKSAVSRIKSEE